MQGSGNGDSWQFCSSGQLHNQKKQWQNIIYNQWTTLHIKIRLFLMKEESQVDTFPQCFLNDQKSASRQGE
jgi:hypothetical protein